MTPFLKAMLNEAPKAEAVKPVANATECTDCAGTTVAAKSGMEGGIDISKVHSNGADPKAQTMIDNNGKTVIIGRGPLGSLMTAALNNAYQRVPVHTDIKTGLENLTGVDVSRVAANGQVLADTENTSQGVSRSRVLTGVLPPVEDDQNVTCVNAVIQAMSAVRGVDFVFVGDSPLGKNLTQAPGSLTPSKVIPFSNGAPGTIAIESVEVVVRYKTIPEAS